MRLHERVLTWLLGPRPKPLHGIHRQVLEAVGDALPEEHRVPYRAQLGQIRVCRFDPAICELWMRENKAEPRFPTDARALHLARATLHFGKTRVRADVWIIEGRIALIEYGQGIIELVERPADRLSIALRYAAEKESP